MSVRYCFLVEYYNPKGALALSAPIKSSSVEKLWNEVATNLLLFPERYACAKIKVTHDKGNSWELVVELNKMH